MNNQEYIQELTKLSEKAEYILTVCTASMLFSKTGILDGKRATTNKKVFNWTNQIPSAVNWVK